MTDTQSNKSEIKKDTNLIPANAEYIKEFQNCIEVYRIWERDHQVLWEFFDAEDSCLQEVEREGGIYKWLEKNKDGDFYEEVFKIFRKKIRDKSEGMVKAAEERYKKGYFAWSKLWTLEDLARTLKPE